MVSLSHKLTFDDPSFGWILCLCFIIVYGCRLFGVTYGSFRLLSIFHIEYFEPPFFPFTLNKQCNLFKG